MPGSPQKRARRKAKELIESTSTCRTTRAHFRELVETFQAEDTLNQLKACISDAIERYQDNHQMLVHPSELVEALDKLTKIYERLDNVLGTDQKVTTLELRWADENSNDKPGSE